MQRPDTPTVPEAPPAHPLALDLAERLASGQGERVLLLGIGSGRSVPPFLAIGARVDALEDDAERARAAAVRFAAEPRVRVVRARYVGPFPVAGGLMGALSTHALLHGTPSSVAAAVAAVRNRLRPGAPFFATLGSTRDPRFGRGVRLDEATFAPETGGEAGVPHVYYDETRARALFAAFAVESLVETAAAETVGRWAHDDADAATIVHWFVRASVR
jgi:hypothetical protein